MPPIQINYANSNSLLVINHHGIMKQLFVPIKVRCVLPIGILRENSVLYVEQVEAHPQYRIIYRVFDE